MLDFRLLPVESACDEEILQKEIDDKAEAQNVEWP
jgi:hypothetical protein